MVNSTVKHLSYRLFPGHCLLCLSPSHRDRDLCEPCETELPWLDSRCRRCALPLANAGICGQCLQVPPRFDVCHASWRYDFPVDHLISRFKYHRDQASGALLCELALPYLRAQEKPDTLLAVPMHWQRRLRRGFNHTEIIAQHWSRQLAIPRFRGIRRQRATPTQQGLSATARHRNLRKAFSLEENAALEGRHIAIVDDVLTTGATANTLAAILRRAGAAQVTVWCLARTP